MRKLFYFLIIVILTITTSMNLHARRWYVDCTAPAGGDGLSWATAQRDLQFVINDTSKSGDEIWVKGFTTNIYYYPGQFSIDSTQYYATSWPAIHDPNDPYKYQDFDAKNKSLKIYGGFKGDEVILSDRIEWATYKTVLKTHQSATGPCHVININGSDQTILDGFFIEGNATNYPLIITGGSNNLQILSNLVIRNNMPINLDGGILYCEGTSTVKLFNVEIANNTYTAGSALISNYLSNMELYNVTIAYNNRNNISIPAFKIQSSNFHVYNSIIWKTGVYNLISGSAKLNDCLLETSYKSSLPAAVVQNNVITSSSAGFVRVSNIGINNNNYRLTSSSPAIQAGDPYVYYDTYEPYTIAPFTAVTNFVNSDLDCKLRLDFINGTDYIDIGAYQYGSVPLSTSSSYAPMRANQQEEDDDEVINYEQWITSNEISMFPTLIKTQNTVYVENIQGNATGRIYTTNGMCIGTHLLSDGLASFSAPNTPGIYIVIVSGENGDELYNTKLVVTP